MTYYAMSDVHGNKELFDKAIDFMDKHGEWKCIFLGDAADRGIKGYAIMKELLSHDSFVYLYGNHEDLFIKAANQLTKCWEREDRPCSMKAYYNVMCYSLDDVALHTYNGGYETIRDWMRDAPAARIEILQKLAALPLIASYKQYDFIHAGCTKQELVDQNCEAMVWSRKHFSEPWFEDRVLIHGHTPIFSLNKLNITVSGDLREKTLIYNDKTKWDIDCGTYNSKHLELVRLDDDGIDKCEVIDLHV